MNTVRLLKKHTPYLSWGVYAAAALLVVATVTRVSGYVASTRQLAETVEQCKAQNKDNEQKVKDLLAKGKETGDRLKKKNAFTPPPPKPNPPVCQGIIGDRALFGDDLRKVGDKVGEAEIVSVGTTQVVIKWEGKEMTLVPFDTDSRSSGGGSGRPSEPDGRGGPPRPEGSSGRGPTQGSASTTEIRPGGPGGPGSPGGPGGPGNFMNMSPEERQQMIDRFRNMSPEERDRFREEQRRRFGERGGFGDPRGGRGR